MAKAKGNVIINVDWCKGCGLCTTVCPVGIVVLSTKKINSKGYHPVEITDMDQCTGCSSCATMCPDSVLTIQREIIR